MRAVCPRSIVLRTSWVYAATGKNFVLTMLNLARTRDHLRVVADQAGCPTLAGDLADAILGIADLLDRDGWQDRFAGVFHAAGTGATTWHGLASAAIAATASFGQKQPVVEPISTAEYPTPARRPADSRLDCGKLEQVFGLRLPPWQDALSRTINTLFSDIAAADTGRARLSLSGHDAAFRPAAHCRAALAAQWRGVPAGPARQLRRPGPRELGAALAR